MQEILDQKEFPKTKMLSTICSAKQHTHTMHKMRYDLTRYLADRLPELDWFGHGIREIDNKTVAMDDYKYHLCVEKPSGTPPLDGKACGRLCRHDPPLLCRGSACHGMLPAGKFHPRPHGRSRESL